MTRAMWTICALGLCGLMGCGADGAPTNPDAPTATPPPQVTTSIGVGIGSSGTYVGGGVGFYQGPLGIFVGF